MDNSYRANEEVIENLYNTVAEDANVKHALSEKVKNLESQILHLRVENQARDEAKASTIEKIKELFLSYKTALALFGATPYDLPCDLDI